jgi:hypothetical protein
MLVTDILRNSASAARGSEKRRCYQVSNGGLLDVVMMPVDVLNNQPLIAGEKIGYV